MPKTIAQPAIAAALGIASLISLACTSASGGNANNSVRPSDIENQIEEAEVLSSENVFTVDNPDADAWADSVMATLSPRERIAQLFVPRFDITKTAKQKIHRCIAIDKMGGILLGKGSLQQHIDLTNSAQEEAQVPLMITFDGEWGLSMRIPEAPRFPYNIAIGAANDENLTYKFGREMARECQLMGVQVNFAPVLDVNSNSANPVIGYRSFGGAPELVGRLGTAYMRGLIDGNVLPVGKHFPGHGDTSTDSHKTLPVINHDIARIESIEMQPFAMAMDAGLPSVMVAHLKIPAMDSSGTPASLSHRITTGWLQDSLDFNGLIFTDALAMKGAALTNENNCVSALLAGADILLGSTAPEEDLKAVEAAVKSGKITQELINSRCRKVLNYKYRLGLSSKPRIVATGMSRKLNSSHADSIITAISEKAVTLLKNGNGLLPLKSVSSKNTLIINIGASADNTFTSQLRQFAGNVTALSINNANPIASSTINAVKKADIVILTLYSDRAWAHAAFNKLATPGKTIGVFFNNPFKLTGLSSYGKLDASVVAYGDIPQLQKAAAKALSGKIPFSGTMPVNLPGVAKIGDGIK